MYWLLTAAVVGAAPSVAIVPPVPVGGGDTWLGFAVADNLETTLLRHGIVKKGKRKGGGSLSVLSFRQSLSAARHEGIDTSKILKPAEVRRLGKQLGARYVFDGSYRVKSDKNEGVLLKWRLTDVKGKRKPKTGKVKTNKRTLSARTQKLAAGVLKHLGQSLAKKKAKAKLSYEALSLYGRGLEILSQQSLNPRARLVIAEQDLRRAHGFFGAASREAPQMLRAAVARAITNTMGGKAELAEEWLAAAAEAGGELEPVYVLGRFYLHERQGRSDKAIEALTEGIDANPGFLRAVGYLGEAYLRHDQPERALEVFAAYKKRVPDSPWARLMHARALARLGQHDEAIKEVKALAQRHPRSATIAANLATRQIEAERFDGARRVLEKALKMHEGHPHLLTRLAFLEIKANKPEAAVEFARQAVDKLGAGRGEPIAGYAHANLGHALALLGRQIEAKRAFEQAEALGLQMEDKKRLLQEPEVAKLMKGSDGSATKEDGPKLGNELGNEDGKELTSSKANGPPKEGDATEQWEEDAAFTSDEDWKH